MRRRKGADGVLEAVVYVMLLIPIVAVYLLKMIVKGIKYLIDLNKKQNFEEIVADIKEVDRMDGLEFERYVASVLRKNGFTNVAVTKASGDYGVDITARKGKERWAFQCKCYQSTLGLKPIQEVYAGSKKYNASKAAVVTNSHFSKNARVLAQELNVELWDREILKGVIWKSHKTEEQPVAQPTVDVNSCTSMEKQTELKPVALQEHIKKPEKMEEVDMATVIGSGKYVFGEDIPMGKYDLKATSGSGMLMIQTSEAKNGEDVEERWHNMSPDKKNFAETYHGLSLPYGWYFILDGDLKVEITRTKMLEIE